MFSIHCISNYKFIKEITVCNKLVPKKYTAIAVRDLENKKKFRIGRNISWRSNKTFNMFKELA